MTRSARFSLLLSRLAGCVIALAAPAAHAADPAHPGPGLSSLVDPDDDALLRFKSRVAQSSDLRVRIALSAPDMVERDGVYSFVPDTALEALVEQARGSTDPIVLWLLTNRCIAARADDRPHCDPIAMAERWTIADTQNQLAWLTLAHVQELAGRPANARDVFVRGAQASSWREYSFALNQALAASVPTGSLTARQRLSLLDAAPGIGFAVPVPFQTLGRACKDRTLQDACLRYLDAIARDADNLMTLRIVAVYSGRAGASDAVVRARNRKSDATLYAITKLAPPVDDADLDVALRRAQDRIAASEATRASRYLADAHLTEEDGARLFDASLTEEQRRYRGDAMRPWSAPGATGSAR